MTSQTTNLHTITAVMKGTKERIYSAVTELHKESQKADAYTGIAKTYQKASEDGEEFFEAPKRVTRTATDTLSQIALLSTEVFDLTLRQETANTTAFADVIVENTPLLIHIPVTYLMFLEKQLLDIRTMVAKLPVLDENKEWSVDGTTGLYRAPDIRTHRTKKVPKVVVKYPATVEHPAQTELLQEDVIAGYWTTVLTSGAMPQTRKDELLRRVNLLITATKTAREKANEAQVDDLQVGGAIFGYLFR